MKELGGNHLKLQRVEFKPLSWDSPIHLPAGHIIQVVGNKSPHSYLFISHDIQGGNSPQGELFAYENQQSTFQTPATLVTLHPATYLAQTHVPYLEFRYETDKGRTKHTLLPVYDSVLVAYDAGLAKRYIKEYEARVARQPFEDETTQVTIQRLANYFQAQPQGAAVAKELQKLINGQ